MYMHQLRSIHLEVSQWSPHPNLSGQRALAAEMRAFCPSLRHVTFWIQATRFRWHFVQEWVSQVDLNQHPQFDPVWSSV